MYMTGGYIILCPPVFFLITGLSGEKMTQILYNETLDSSDSVDGSDVKQKGTLSIRIPFR